MTPAELAVRLRLAEEPEPLLVGCKIEREAWPCVICGVPLRGGVMILAGPVVGWQGKLADEEVPG